MSLFTLVKKKEINLAYCAKIPVQEFNTWKFMARNLCLSFSEE